MTYMNYKNLFGDKSHVTNSLHTVSYMYAVYGILNPHSKFYSY